MGGFFVLKGILKLTFTVYIKCVQMIYIYIPISNMYIISQIASNLFVTILRYAIFLGGNVLFTTSKTWFCIKCLEKFNKILSQLLV